MAEEDAELETVVRALSAWGIEAAVVPGDLPVAVADHLRGAGIAITVDSRAVSARRRVKSAAELDGIRRAQRAAEAGMAVAERLIRGAPRRGDTAGPHGRGRARADARGVRGRGRAGAAGHHGRLRPVRRRPRSRLRAAAGRPADRRRPVAARRAQRLLGRHDPHVRRGRGERGGRRAGRRRPRGRRGRARRRAAGDQRPRALRRGGRRRRARGPPDAAHAHARRDARLLLQPRARRRPRGARVALARARRPARRSSPAT